MFDELLGEQQQLRASVPIHERGQAGVHLREGNPTRNQSAINCKFVRVVDVVVGFLSLTSAGRSSETTKAIARFKRVRLCCCCYFSCNKFVVG